MFCSYGGTMTHLILNSVGGMSHFGATSLAGHIFIWNSPNTIHCKMVPSQARHSVMCKFL